jgi:hypothetical protein
MKIFLVLLSLLFSCQTFAACKCSCDPTDRSLCASNYDLDNPCGGACPAQSSVLGPIWTACPPVILFNPISGTKVWVSKCTQ